MSEKKNDETKGNIFAQDAGFQERKQELEDFKKGNAGRFTEVREDEEPETPDPVKDPDTPSEEPEKPDTPEDTPDEDQPTDPIDDPEEGEDDEDDDETPAAASKSDDDDEDDDEDDEEDPTGQDKKQGTKIPIVRFHKERRKRKELQQQLKDLNKKVDQLSAASQGAPSTKADDKAIKEWAEKNGLNKDHISELASMIRETAKPDREAFLKETFGDDFSPENLKEVMTHVATSKEKAKFEREFNTFLPELKKQYPNATDDQLTKVKQKLDKISHDDWGRDKDLDYIAFKKKSTLDKIFVQPGADPTPAKKQVKGPETGRMGQGSPQTYTAKDFEGDSPKPFSVLDKLPDADRKKIVSEMNPFARHEYYKTLGNGGGDLIKRGGKTIGKI